MSNLSSKPPPPSFDSLEMAWKGVLLTLNAGLFIMAYYGIVTLSALWAQAHGGPGDVTNSTLTWPDILVAFDWVSLTVVVIFAILWAIATTRLGIFDQIRVPVARKSRSKTAAT